MLDSPLGQLKALIWAHSVIAAALLVGCFAGVECGWHPWVLSGIICCAPVWIFGLVPLGRRASDLQPEDIVPATGLPDRLLAVCAGVQFVGMVFGRTAYDGWLAVAYTAAIVTLMARRILSSILAVPIHQKTWTVCVFLVGVGLGRHLFGWMLKGL